MRFLPLRAYKVLVDCHNCGKKDKRRIPIGHRVIEINGDKVAGLMEAKDFPDKEAEPIRWLRCQFCGVYTTLFLKRNKDAKRTT
jgi:hypothetical protein